MHGRTNQKNNPQVPPPTSHPDIRTPPPAARRSASTHGAAYSEPKGRGSHGSIRDNRPMREDQGRGRCSFGANTRRGRASFCRNPGGSASAKILFSFSACHVLLAGQSLAQAVYQHLLTPHILDSPNCTPVRCHFHPDFPPEIATVFNRSQHVKCPASFGNGRTRPHRSAVT